MSDNDKEPQTWANMSALNKATFIEQLLAPLALLTTVVFSYFSWAEARRSAEVQQDIFAAQFAPKLDVTRALFGFGDEAQTSTLLRTTLADLPLTLSVWKPLLALIKPDLRFQTPAMPPRT